MVDRTRCKRVPQGECFVVLRPMDSLGYQGVSLEGLKLKRGDLTLGHVSKDRADVCFVAIDARSMVFQGWKTLFPENFLCLCIGQILNPRLGKEFGVALLAYMFTPYFTCQYSGIAFATPTDLLPYQLPIELVRSDVEADVRLAVIALCATCAVMTPVYFVFSRWAICAYPLLTLGRKC